MMYSVFLSPGEVDKDAVKGQWQDGGPPSDEKFCSYCRTAIDRYKVFQGSVPSFVSAGSTGTGCRLCKFLKAKCISLGYSVTDDRLKGAFPRWEIYSPDRHTSSLKLLPLSGMSRLSIPLQHLCTLAPFLMKHLRLEMSVCLPLSLANTSSGE